MKGERCDICAGSLIGERYDHTLVFAGREEGYDQFPRIAFIHKRCLAHRPEWDRAYLGTYGGVWLDKRDARASLDIIRANHGEDLTLNDGEALRRYEKLLLGNGAKLGDQQCLSAARKRHEAK